MNNHQSLKAEIDAREENFNVCISLGRDLLNRKHYASSEIEKKLIKLTTERADMMRRWEDRWEYLQLSKQSRDSCHIFNCHEYLCNGRYLIYVLAKFPVTVLLCTDVL